MFKDISAAGLFQNDRPLVWIYRRILYINRSVELKMTAAEISIHVMFKSFHFFHNIREQDH